MPSPAYALCVEPQGETRAMLTFSEALADRYAGLPDDSGRGAVFEHRSGRGRAIYFACDFGAAVWKWRLPEHLALVRKLVREAGELTLELPDAPPCIDLSLRQSRDGSRVFVHLVNYNGGMTRPMEHVLPLTEVFVKLRSRADGARTLFHQRPLEVEQAGEWSCVKLDRLGEYEVIEFKVAPTGKK